jgi:uncharacterized membrane protein (UPF0127 family)
MWAVWAMMLMMHSALHGCNSTPTPPPIKGKVADAVIKGKTYHLEIAADPAVRMKGLGQRDHIDEDGGMIFVFAPSEVRVMGFIMRDCPIAIDILYLDGSGHVMTMYEMQPEPARGDKGKDEGKPGDWESKAGQSYDARLKQYSSRFACTYAIELKDGSIKKLGVKEGDKVEFDRDGLKKLMK